MSSVKDYDHLPPAGQHCIAELIDRIGVDTRNIRPKNASSSSALVESIRQYLINTVAHISAQDEGSVSNDPCDVIARGWGLCYNRSYLFELIMQKLGLQTRHVAIYTDLLHQGRSHALSEVRISDQWLGVDTTYAHIRFQVGEDFSTVSEALRRGDLKGKDPLFDQDVYVFYGIYSRSGKMYEPKILFPDVRVLELFYNLDPSRLRLSHRRLAFAL